VCYNGEILFGSWNMAVSGKPLSPEIKRIIVTLKGYFDRNKADLVGFASAQLTADALELNRATVDRVMRDYRRDPNSIDNLQKMRGKPSYAVDASNQEVVRAYVRKANLEGSYITLETIRDYLIERSPEEQFSVRTLSRALDRWGFEFGKGIRTQHLKEKDHVIVARQRYLRAIRSNRSPLKDETTIRPEVYIDESYVNKNHSNDFTWYVEEDGPWIQKPTGKGERLIIMNAITKDGWVPGAKNVFKSTRKTGDYHGQMNAGQFQRWFSEMLLPNIPPNSIIVMDNASYHKALIEDSAPISTSSKKRIRDWLEKNDIPCRDDCLRVELITMLNKIAPNPTYVIDEIAYRHGHKVLRTPPYHPELQPIEICWGIVKNEVARNCNFTMKNLENQLEEAFKNVISETCEKIIKRIRKVEDKFWDEDAKMDQLREGDAGQLWEEDVEGLWEEDTEIDQIQ
jgi:transposase